MLAPPLVTHWLRNGGQAPQISCELGESGEDGERERMDIKIRVEDCFHLSSLSLFSALNRSRKKTVSIYWNLCF